MKTILKIPSLICTFCLLAGLAQANDTFKVYVNTTSKSYSIPAHFSGLAFEMGSLTKNHSGVSGYMFDSTNSELLTLFNNMAIANIRMGGGSVDVEIPNGYGSDGYTGVDKLFDFAQSAGVNVIYSLRQFCTNSTDLTTYELEDASIASHIWNRNRSQLDYFCIGNEPNLYQYASPTDPYTLNYPAYLGNWNDFAATIVASVPSASFGAPDTADLEGSTLTFYNGKSWTQNFAEDKKNGNVTVPIIDVTQHNYVGANSASTPQAGIDGMLSASWDTGTNQWLYNNILSGVLATGWGYRMTEADDYSPGVAGASDRFSAALWALDYMNWMAAHGCHGVNFEGLQWNTNCLIRLTASGHYYATPKGLGVRAFNLAAPGNFVEAVTNVYNPQNVSATAYAVGNTTNLYVTIVNKTHAANASSTFGYGTNLTVTIYPGGFSGSHGQYMLMAPGSNGPGATTGTLGGQSITNNSTWNGSWTSLTVTNGQCTLTVPGCSAAVVHIY